MSIEGQVFSAAADGDLQCLNAILGKRSAAEIKQIVSSRVAGTTSLLYACKNGHLAVVQYLVETCHADIEQVGLISFDQELIEDVSPLWCAAAAGHLHVVQQLIAYNAHVNCQSKTKSTPLRAACFDGYLPIVKFLVAHGADVEIPNHHGHTCLMIACYKGHIKVVEFLLQHGANVNAKSLRGNTALHDAAESNHVGIMKLLLQYGAVMCEDSFGVTPLLAAAHETSSEVVDYVISCDLCSLEEAVDAVELLGTSYFDKDQDIKKALGCWKLGFYYRYKNSKMPLHKPVYNSYINHHIKAAEAATLSELEDLALDTDGLIFHSLIVRERILGPSHPDTAYYIRYRGALYADRGNFNLCLKLWLYATDVQQAVLEPCDPMTVACFKSFTELFSSTMSKQLSGVRRKPYFDFHDWMLVFQRAVNEIKCGMLKVRPDNIQKMQLLRRIILIALNILAQLFGGLTDCSEEEEEGQLKPVLQELIKLDFRGLKRETLLHLVCGKECSDLSRPFSLFPNQKLAELLLEAGALPNVFDINFNTPLHEVAKCVPQHDGLFKTLLKHGAHIDLRNKCGKTAIELSSCPHRLEVYTVRYLTLQCLCAQVICKSRINQCKLGGLLPKTLETFLKYH